MKNLYTAAYDFRYGPNNNPKFMNLFKNQIE